MSKAKNNVDDLLAAIKRQTASPASVKTAVESIEPKRQEKEEPLRQEVLKKRPAVKKSQKALGKPVQFWMHEEDRKIVRELSAWLAGQGIRPTDSMVIRAVLRVAKTGNGLLEAYWQAAKLDGRLKRD
jgi:hypothetical protein